VLDSVRVRLTLRYMGVLTLVLMLFSVGVYTLMERKLANRLDLNLRTGVEGMVRLFVHEKDEGETDQYAARSTLRKSYFPRQAIAFYDARGTLLDEQPLNGAIHSPLPQTSLASGATGIQFSTLPQARTGAEDGLRVAAYSISAHSMKSPCFVVIAEPLADLSDDLELLRGILYLAVAVAVALAGFSGWFLARNALAPVVAMSERARRISAENLEQRLPVANPRDELGRLATTFNELLSRLNNAFTEQEQAFAQQRQFMADASHELRTPVSVIRTASEVTLEQQYRENSEYREALVMVGQQARRLTRIVEEMFTLARADAGQRALKPADFYLDELVAETARAATILAARKKLALETRLVSEAFFRGDEDLLRQMLLNLLDNAIKYTSAGGQIRLGLERQDGHYKITVADTGTGIPLEAQSQVFKRFFRIDKARLRVEQANGGGAGLGLSIALWIAEAHGGSLRLQRSDETGSVFVASLPAPRLGAQASLPA